MKKITILLTSFSLLFLIYFFFKEFNTPELIESRVNHTEKESNTKIKKQKFEKISLDAKKKAEHIVQEKFITNQSVVESFKSSLKIIRELKNNVFSKESTDLMWDKLIENSKIEDLLKKILLEPSYSQSTFKSDQGLARVVAIKLLFLIAKNNDAYILNEVVEKIGNKILSMDNDELRNNKGIRVDHEELILRLFQVQKSLIISDPAFAFSNMNLKREFEVCYHDALSVIISNLDEKDKIKIIEEFNSFFKS